MLVLSKFDNIRNINVTFKSDDRESIAKTTKSVTLFPWTLNVLNDEEEATFEEGRRTSPELQHWISEGLVRVIPVGGKRNSEAEEAAAVEAEEKAQDAAAALETAKTPAEKKKAQAALDAAKKKAAQLRAIADAPTGLGDTMPKTLDKVEDTTLAAEMVEGVIDLVQLNAWLRSEKRTKVILAINAQVKRVEDMENKAKEQMSA